MSVETLDEVRDLQGSSHPPHESRISAASVATGFSESEFSYRPVPVIAVVGSMLALFSTPAVFIWMVLPFAVISLMISVLALLKIKRSFGAYSGTGVALAGIVLSMATLLGGVAYQIYAYRTEVPDGYQRVSFIKEISAKGVIEENGVSQVHPDLVAMDGKKVFVKGYIYQTGKMHNLDSFLFVKDNQDCCFGAEVALSDRLGVVMQDGKTIDYKAGKVAVAGTFRLNPNYDPYGELDPIYMIEADLFTSRVSDF